MCSFNMYMKSEDMGDEKAKIHMSWGLRTNEKL
jgi:hypothetical protein